MRVSGSGDVTVSGNPTDVEDNPRLIIAVARTLAWRLVALNQQVERAA